MHDKVITIIFTCAAVLKYFSSSVWLHARRLVFRLNFQRVLLAGWLARRGWLPRNPGGGCNHLVMWISFFRTRHFLLSISQRISSLNPAAAKDLQSVKTTFNLLLYAAPSTLFMLIDFLNRIITEEIAIIKDSHIKTVRRADVCILFSTICP